MRIKYNEKLHNKDISKIKRVETKLIHPLL